MQLFNYVDFLEFVYQFHEALPQLVLALEWVKFCTKKLTDQKVIETPDWPRCPGVIHRIKTHL